MLPDSLAKACAARSMLDLRVGAAFTRFQCLRLQQLYPNLFGRGHLISYGGCQFPTLGFVVDRYRQAERFVSEDFWKLQVKHAFQQPDGTRSAPVEFLWKRYRIPIFKAVLMAPLESMCLKSSSVKYYWKCARKTPRPRFSAFRATTGPAAGQPGSLRR